MGETAWEARAGLKQVSLKRRPEHHPGRTGLGSPCGIETPHTLGWSCSTRTGEMAWEACAGLKQAACSRDRLDLCWAKRLPARLRA